MNIKVHLSFWINVFVFFKYLSRNGTDASYGNSISNFLRNLHTDFHIDFTNLHSHQQYTSIPFSPLPHQHLLFFVILILVILPDVKSCLIVVLICISLIAMLSIFSCVCWPSVWLLWENVYSKEEKMSGPLPVFWFCCSFFFLCWVVWLLCIFWLLTSIRYIIWKYFIPFSRLLFHLVDNFLHCAKAF